MASKRSVIYELLRPLVWSGIRLFFRRVVVRNRHKLPLSRPVVIVANHQNALLDPVLLCVSVSPQLHWLTRADVFKNKAVSSFLHRINMMPVYRERDRVADLHDRNNAIFQKCYTRLKHHAVIGIFPEGTHRGKKQLVQLKKGLARLVIGAYESGVRNLCIVPVGLDYESFYDPQKNLIINFGDPIELDTMLQEHFSNHSKLHADITLEVYEALKKLMIHINSDDVYSEILSLKPLIDELHADETIEARFDIFHRLSAYLDKHPEHHHYLNHEVNEYRSMGHRLKIDDALAQHKPQWWRWFFLLIGTPFAALAAAIFWPMQLMTERFVHTVIKDTLFRNSIRISFWTFLSPMYLFLFWIVLRWAGISGVWLWLPAVAALAGLVTLPWWRNVKFIRQYLRRIGLSSDEEFSQWKSKREAIKQWIKTLPFNSNHV